MSDNKPKIHAMLRRPIDCSLQNIELFIKIVLASGEVPVENLNRGVPAAEMLIFVMQEKVVIGVCALRYPNAKFHKHLFEKATVPEMYNPHSLEACWASILPNYRNQGALSSIYKTTQKYTEHRPMHGVHRAENNLISEPIKKLGYVQAGIDFYSDTSDNKLCLIVKNHDPVFDPNKKMRYS